MEKSERIMKEFTNDLQHRRRPRLIMRRTFLMIAVKTLFIRKFVMIIDYIFYCVTYAYVFINFYGNMRIARLNPDVNTMLQ